MLKKSNAAREKLSAAGFKVDYSLELDTVFATNGPICISYMVELEDLIPAICWSRRSAIY